MAPVTRLHFTGDRDADEFLARDPLALLLGMLLDQQVPMEWAFRSPAALRQRLGTKGLDAGHIAALDPETLVEIFGAKPALHRYPGSMARRAHALCEHIVEHHGGRADAVWAEATSGEQLFDRLVALPGYGKEKAKIFVAILGRFMDVQPDGWRDFQATWPSVADADGPGAMEKIRQAKAAWKASGKKKA